MFNNVIQHSRVLVKRMMRIVVRNSLKTWWSVNHNERGRERLTG